VSRGAALVAAALLLTGCAQGTSNGFSATPPEGWKDETDTAESRTRAELEVVYEGPRVDGVYPAITVSRVKTDAELSLAATRARVALDRSLKGADPTLPVGTRLGGKPAFAFDYRIGRQRARYITARHGPHIYAVIVQASSGGFARARRIFDAYLASWTWD
jgi:hypothetical protein